MSKINDITYLVGSENFGTRPFKPYNKITCDFLIEFSKKLNLQKDVNKISDLKALAFWCRKQNIENLIKKSLSNESKLCLWAIFSSSSSKTSS